MTVERVQKVLAAAGVGSRRACEELIADGRVTVDGEKVTLGAKADPTAQIIAVDGERVAVDPRLVHLMLNKPPQVVTTASDPKGRRTVLDLVPEKPRVYPVGRLDRDTEGLLLLTNDGELAHRLAHPRFEIEKTYVAQVAAPVPKGLMGRLRAGVELDDGTAHVLSARQLGSDSKRVLIELTLAEGRKREVRRLLAAVGHPVQRLARVRIGPLTLGELSTGKYRPLNGREVRDLYRAVGLGAEPDGGDDRADDGSARTSGRRQA
ncbi:pseudouridine synthase [Egibacter rhizosphaerae]|uniref:pseudouridine synthase n=1 Tax=Egibacter rhizosphaerae TaxID=1670831 RepID=UPI00197AC4A4|nr:pseudouridine synthase [Egibacter rhizosphaerae]